MIFKKRLQINAKIMPMEELIQLIRLTDKEVKSVLILKEVTSLEDKIEVCELKYCFKSTAK